MPSPLPVAGDGVSAQWLPWPGSRRPHRVISRRGTQPAWQPQRVPFVYPLTYGCLSSSRPFKVAKKDSISFVSEINCLKRECQVLSSLFLFIQIDSFLPGKLRSQLPCRKSLPLGKETQSPLDWTQPAAYLWRRSKWGDNQESCFPPPRLLFSPSLPGCEFKGLKGLPLPWQRERWCQQAFRVHARVHFRQGNALRSGPDPSTSF